MNNSPRTELEAYLDSTLAALQVRGEHKRLMREEMLSHLTCIFDEELVRLGDPQAALNETLRRFGAPEELGKELDSSVPFSERFITWLVAHREKIMWFFFMALGVVGTLVGAGLICPAVAQILGHEPMSLTVLLLAVGIAICLASLWSFAHGVQRFRMRHV